MTTDAALIEHLGGPAKVAKLLGLNGKHATQRVHNWLSRGIPPKVKLQRPDLFLADLKVRKSRAAAKSSE